MLGDLDTFYGFITIIDRSWRSSIKLRSGSLSILPR